VDSRSTIMNLRFLSSLALLLTSYVVADDILDIATNPSYNGLFNTFVTALNTAGIAKYLDYPDYCNYYPYFWCRQYTVFAPTTDAFAKLPQGTLERLLSEEFRPHLIDLLRYHVVDGEIFSSDITDGAVVDTNNGETILANVNENTITINSNSKVITPDIDASNGVVHVVDNVLLPSSAAKNIVEATEADFSTFVSLLRTAQYGLVDIVSDTESVLTVFAPTNEAFNKLVEDGFDTSDPIAVADLLKYHIVEDRIITSHELLHEGDISTLEGSPISVSLYWSGYKIKLNGGVSITEANILASNGIIHAIDTVLNIPDSLGDIVSVASNNPDFSDLVTALTKAELVTTLQETGPFTVFAPTNDAFIKAGIDVSTATKEELTPILLYHVLGGLKVLSGDLSSSVIQTNPNNPTNLIVDVSGWFRRHITLNDDVNVINVDIKASNGVIHVIDDVLIPPDNIVDIASKSDEFSTLVDQLSADGIDLVPILADGGPYTLFAPTNAAFERLGDVGLSTDELKSVLLYHVTPGNYRLSDVISEDKLDTAFMREGVTQTIQVIVERYWFRYWFWITGMGVKGDWNEAKSSIVTEDIVAANGFIHAIDEVLLPNYSL